MGSGATIAREKGNVSLFTGFAIALLGLRKNAIATFVSHGLIDQ
jgi:hypothetical protein